MVSVFSPFKEMTSDEFRRVTEVTYLGVVYGTMAALRYMIPRNRGTIVQVGSALAYRRIPLQSAYCGAKHAIRGFTDSLRSELLHDKINGHLTMVQLPALNTPQFQMGQKPFALPATARPSDLSARGCRPRYLLGRTPPSSRITCRIFVGESDHRKQDFSR